MPNSPHVPTPRRARSLPDIRALEAFVAVGESGSMALAAQKLGLSQSAVSQHVKALEAEYGLQLVDREVRPAQLTRAGRALLALAADLLSGAHALAAKMHASARQDDAQIRLGCVDSFAATVGPQLIHAFSGSARQIQLCSGLTPTLSTQLRGRELDLAICTDLGSLDAGMSQRRLFSEAWVAVFPRQHPVGRLETIGELGQSAGDLPLIRYSQRSVTGQQVEQYLRHVGVHAVRRFEFDATDPLLSLVAAGLGWAISTPLCLLQSRQYLPAVTVLPLPLAHLRQREFYLLSREGEWDGLCQEIARVTHEVLRHDTAPAIRSAMPALPADTLFCPDEKTL